MPPRPVPPPPPPSHYEWLFGRPQAEQFRVLRQDLLDRIFRCDFRHNYILRGSTVLKHWFSEEAREPNDLDLVAKYPHDPERCITEILAACHDRSLGPNVFPLTRQNVLPMWEYDVFPGVRFHVPCGPGYRLPTVQLDVAFDNTPPLPYERIELKSDPNRPGVFVKAWTREACLASKLCWIATDSADGKAAESDDIRDALLLVEHGEIDGAVVRELVPAILAAQQKDVSVFGNWDERVVAAMELGTPPMTGEPTRWVNAGSFAEGRANREVMNAERNAMLRDLQPPLGRLLDGLVWFPTAEEWAFLIRMARHRNDRLMPLVYADWLDDQGDPRGELLRLYVHEVAGNTLTKEQKQRRDELKVVVPSRWLTLAGVG